MFGAATKSIAQWYDDNREEARHQSKHYEFSRHDFVFRPVAPIDWKRQLIAWTKSDSGRAWFTAERARRQQVHLRRSAAARAAAKTRRTTKLLKATPYRRLLLALKTAQQASDRAKSRSANGVYFRDYQCGY